MKAKTKTVTKVTKEQLAARKVALAQFTEGCRVVQSATQSLITLAKEALKLGVSRKELTAAAESTGLHPRTIQNVLTLAARAAGLARARNTGAKYSVQAIRLALYCASIYGSEGTAKKLLLSARRFLTLPATKRKAVSRVATMLPKVTLPKEHGTVKGKGRAIGAASLTKSGVLRNQKAA